MTVETVCKRREGMETTGKETGRGKVGKGTGSGTVNTWDENKTPYGGMVDGGNRYQGLEWSGNRGQA